MTGISDDQLLEYATKMVSAVAEGDGDIAGVADVLTTVHQIAASNNRRRITAEEAAALRAPFPPEAIGKLPRITCKACSDSNSRVCSNDNHVKKRCEDCGNWITSAHVDLDYVGHAWVTDRLLSVDPDWNWEAIKDPEALGLPVVPGAMWIALTVCGVTRYGIGDAVGKKGADGTKEIIGDALRNAAMRFGVALDLWMKDRHGSAPAERSAERAGGQRSGRPARAAVKQTPTGPARTLAQTRTDLHDRMKALPDSNRLATMNAFVQAFGDPNDLKARDVQKAQALVAAAEASTSTSAAPAKKAPARRRQRPPEEPAVENTPTDEGETIAQRHLRLAEDLVKGLGTDQLSDELAMYELAEPETRAKAVELLAVAYADEWGESFPDGISDEDYEAWLGTPEGSPDSEDGGSPPEPAGES